MKFKLVLQISWTLLLLATYINLVIKSIGHKDYAMIGIEIMALIACLFATWSW